MFSAEDFDIVRLEEVQQAIEANISRTPTDIALDRRVPYAAVVATQVKRLQRAKSKLPSYYAVRACLPPLSYEQSSSEECAVRKPLSGGSLLDLTCGLGVDAAMLSRRFERVVTCERNEVLAEVARENFARLGCHNIEVCALSAEQFVEQCTDHFDWCFIDPDRRGASGEKLVRLEECSPNIVALYRPILKIADRLCIKCSPLFDTAEAQRLFGDCRVETVSLGGECKEVNIYIDGSPSSRSAVAIGLGEVCLTTDEAERQQWSAPPQSFADYHYIILPDVALGHSRLTAAAFEGVADVWSHNGVALARTEPQKAMGRVARIASIEPFDPKRLKKRLRGKAIEIYRRDFPLSNAQLCRQLGVREGASERWCFTRIEGQSVAIEMIF